MEYAFPVFHDSLPVYLSNELEGVQKRAMRIIFPFCSYKESLVESGLSKLSSCRQELVGKLFKKVVQNKENKLHSLLPAHNTCKPNLRNARKFRPAFKTNRFGLLRPTPSKLKLKLFSRSIVLEVLFPFYCRFFII